MPEPQAPSITSSATKVTIDLSMAPRRARAASSRPSQHRATGARFDRSSLLVTVCYRAAWLRHVRDRGRVAAPAPCGPFASLNFRRAASAWALRILAPRRGGERRAVFLGQEAQLLSQFSKVAPRARPRVNRLSRTRRTPPEAARCGARMSLRGRGRCSALRWRSTARSTAGIRARTTRARRISTAAGLARRPRRGQPQLA